MHWEDKVRKEFRKKVNSCQSIAGNKKKKRRNGKKMGRQDRRKTFKIKSQIYTDMSGERLHEHAFYTITTKEGNMVTISVPNP